MEYDSDSDYIDVELLKNIAADVGNPTESIVIFDGEGEKPTDPVMVQLSPAHLHLITSSFNIYLHYLLLRQAFLRQPKGNQAQYEAKCIFERWQMAVYNVATVTNGDNHPRQGALVARDFYDTHDHPCTQKLREELAEKGIKLKLPSSKHFIVQLSEV